ncbi:F-box/LRR-repeat protein At3g26922-like [Rosa rugosa]|uniref:F-box/LRR-repeat protein At3g26922-like n=1 Tax=Rosa rugosa TaxID=74645 RepID=UPI002B4157E9|nr:F-box/LRR-repeat protein At3g26922-like [Rosa rugosa]
MRYHGVGEDEDIVDDWIVFSILTCVKEFDLCLVRGGEFRDVWTTDLNEDVARLYLIPQRIFSSNCLTSLKLENVSYFSRATGTPISLPSLKTMSLKHVEFDEKDGDHRALPRLISGCPSLEHLSLNQCNLGLSTLSLKISSFSLKSLEIMDCHSLDLVVETINLVSFKLVSECSYPYHYDLTLMNCDKLKHLRISSVGLKKLSLLSCCCRMENSIFTPNLVFVMFSGRVKAKVHFVEAPSNLLDAKIGVYFEKRQSTFNYYSDLRDFLESFNCSRKVEISIRDVEVYDFLFDSFSAL